MVDNIIDKMVPPERKKQVSITLDTSILQRLSRINKKFNKLDRSKIINIILDEQLRTMEEVLEKEKSYSKENVERATKKTKMDE